MINHIYEDKNYKFAHNSPAYYGSSGSPILGLNNKVVGLNFGDIKYKKHKKGLFLNLQLKNLLKANIIIILNLKSN